MSKLTPPDPNRCQTIWLGGSFMTLGPRPWVRCEKKATVIAQERAQPRGKMSLCEEHLIECRKKLGRSVTFNKIPLTPRRLTR